MAVLKGMIQSAGLSCILQHGKECQSGTISAFRPNYTAKENQNRHKLLGRLLNSKGYYKCQIQGVFDEGGGNQVKELSYFVWDTQNRNTLLDVLLDLGNKFEQHSITYADADSDYKLYSANPKSSGEPTGTTLATFKGTSFGDTKGSPSYSKIRGRPFMWDNYRETSAGAIEAYKRIKENVNYLMVRYHAIDALEQQIGKVSATAIFAKAEKNPNTPISKFILGTE